MKYHKSAMPIDPKLQAILDADKALNLPPTEHQTPQQLRSGLAQFIARFPPQPQYSAVTAEPRHILHNGRTIPTRIYTPPGEPPFPIVVLFHGGGWVNGSLDSQEPYCRALATEANAVVVSVDYRLAPEHRFPAGLDDCTDATLWVLAHANELKGVATRVLVGGDSAGATLATVVALLLRDQEIRPTLAGQILLYPVAAHYNPPTPSYLENSEGYGLTRNAMIWFWDHYLNDPNEATNPLAAPLNAPDLSHLPPAFLVTAQYDVLRDEGQAYATRLTEAGVPVTHLYLEGMNHGFAASAKEFPHLPQAHTVLRTLADWIASRFSQEITR
jgi:acetyl esterase